MEKLAKRGAIQYLYKKGLSGKEIHDDMVNVLGDDAPSYTQVKFWVAEFKRGRRSISDEPHTGRPKTATTDENIEKIHDMVLEHKQITTVEIAVAVGISVDRTFNILKNELGFRKLLTRWVPHLLTLDQKRNRMKLSKQHLDRFTKEKNDFVRRLITMDETWVYHYDPELRQQRAEWTEAGCSAPKQVKGSKSSKKVMASVFWDAKGILLIDYLQTGRTITGEYYCSLLDQLDEKIREKRPGLKKKKIIFHQDNAPAHKSVRTMAKFQELHYELLEHPPYSPDLAPSDFYLFPNLKRFLRGKRFSSNEEVIAAVDGYFEDLPENHFKNGICGLENRWKMCFEIKGEYVEE